MNKNIQFHISSQDYFATLATILDLLRQDLELDNGRPKDLNLLRKLSAELIYMQNNFIIFSKS